MLCSYSIFPLTDSKKRLTESYFFIENVNKQVRSDNDASEVGILGHFWDILGHFGTIRKNSSLDHLDCFPSHFRPFSSIISSFQKTRDGPKDRRTDPLIEMRGRI